MRYRILSPITFDPIGIQSIRIYRFSSLFRTFRSVRRLVAVDETVLKVNIQICYLGMTYFHETFGKRNRIERCSGR